MSLATQTRLTVDVDAHLETRLAAMHVLPDAASKVIDAGICLPAFARILYSYILL